MSYQQRNCILHYKWKNNNKMEKQQINEEHREIKQYKLTKIKTNKNYLVFFAYYICITNSLSMTDQS